LRLLESGGANSMAAASFVRWVARAEKGWARR
jgi:hypothetical protein